MSEEENQNIEIIKNKGRFSSPSNTTQNTTATNGRSSKRSSVRDQSNVDLESKIKLQLDIGQDSVAEDGSFQKQDPFVTSSEIPISKRNSTLREKRAIKRRSIPKVYNTPENVSPKSLKEDEEEKEEINQEENENEDDLNGWTSINNLLLFMRMDRVSVEFENHKKKYWRLRILNGVLTVLSILMSVFTGSTSLFSLNNINNVDRLTPNLFNNGTSASGLTFQQDQDLLQEVRLIRNLTISVGIIALAGAAIAGIMSWFKFADVIAEEKLIILRLFELYNLMERMFMTDPLQREPAGPFLEFIDNKLIRYLRTTDDLYSNFNDWRARYPNLQDPQNNPQSLQQQQQQSRMGSYNESVYSPSPPMNTGTNNSPFRKEPSPFNYIIDMNKHPSPQNNLFMSTKNSPLRISRPSVDLSPRKKVDPLSTTKKGIQKSNSEYVLTQKNEKHSKISPQHYSEYNPNQIRSHKQKNDNQEDRIEKKIDPDIKQKKDEFLLQKDRDNNNIPTSTPNQSSSSTKKKQNEQSSTSQDNSFIDLPSNNPSTKQKSSISPLNEKSISSKNEKSISSKNENSISSKNETVTPTSSSSSKPLYSMLNQKSIHYSKANSPRYSKNLASSKLSITRELENQMEENMDYPKNSPKIQSNWKNIIQKVLHEKKEEKEKIHPIRSRSSSQSNNNNNNNNSDHNQGKANKKQKESKDNSLSSYNTTPIQPSTPINKSIGSQQRTFSVKDLEKDSRNFMNEIHEDLEKVGLELNKARSLNPSSENTK